MKTINTFKTVDGAKVILARLDKKGPIAGTGFAVYFQYRNDTEMYNLMTFEGSIAASQEFIRRIEREVSYDILTVR